MDINKFELAESYREKIENTKEGLKKLNKINSYENSVEIFIGGLENETKKIIKETIEFEYIKQIEKYEKEFEKI